MFCRPYQRLDDPALDPGPKKEQAHRRLFGKLALALPATVVTLYLVGASGTSEQGHAEPIAPSAPAQRSAGESPSALHEAIARIANEELAKSQHGNFSPAGAAEIARLRSILTAMTSPPLGTAVHAIPLAGDGPPRIDGKIDAGEWDRALRLETGYNEVHTPLFLLADATNLYIAVDVPHERDEREGSFEIGLHPQPQEATESGSFRNESLLASIRRDEALTQRVYGDRRIRYQHSVYARAAAAWHFGEHRQYEVRLDLAESGIHPDHPFAMYANVRTKEALWSDKGQVFHRPWYLGIMGDDSAPIWFNIGETGASVGPAEVADERVHERIVKVTGGRRSLDHAAYLQAGRYTAFYFTSAWCPPCRVLTPKLIDLAKQTPTLSLVVIDVGWLDSPFSMANQIHGVPVLTLYDPEGRLLMEKRLGAEPILKVITAIASQGIPVAQIDK